MPLPDEAVAPSPFVAQEPGAAAMREGMPAEKPADGAGVAGEGGLSEEEKAKAQRVAEHMAHPHTRLTKLQAQLQDRTMLDPAARFANLHSVVSQLVQIIKGHTPAPEAPDGEG